MNLRTQPLSIAKPDAPKSARVRFGLMSAAAAGGELTGVTKVADQFNTFTHANRARSLLFEDLLGFAFLRTMFDMHREYLYKNTQDGERKTNWMAGFERLGMEALGSASDAVGFLGPALGWAVAKNKKANFANHFATYDSKELFETILKDKSVKTHGDFLHVLAKSIAGKEAQATGFIKTQLATLTKDNAEDVATQIARQLKQSHFDRTIAGNTHNLPTVLEDAYGLLKHTPSKIAPQSAQWAKTAQKMVHSSYATNQWRIPLCLGVGMAFNFVAPHFIHKFTEKHYGVTDYPGEAGLRALSKDKQKSNTWFPYLSDSLKNGNPLPLLVSLLPAPILLGMFNPDTKKWNNPLKWGKFSRNVLSMLQFSKSKPYISGAMMALLYALVVDSRVATSRSAIEFRERAIDGYLGWTTWIFGSPFLKEQLSKLFDARKNPDKKTELLKYAANGKLLGQKSTAEIKLIKNPTILKNTLKANTWLGIGSMFGTIALLGALEPYLSIKFTEWQSNRMKKQHPELYTKSTTPTHREAGRSPWASAGQMAYYPYSQPSAWVTNVSQWGVPVQTNW